MAEPLTPHVVLTEVAPDVFSAEGVAPGQTVEVRLRRQVGPEPTIVFGTGTGAGDKAPFAPKPEVNG